MKEIPLSRGKIALINDEDYALVGHLKWYADPQRDNFAAARVTTDRKKVFMHRVILATPDGMHTDHINGNTLDNRRGNLRIVTAVQNSWNRKPRKGHKYRGVMADPRSEKNPWRARIAVDGRHINLGSHPTEIAAAMAWDKAAREYHGEYARLNFPNGLGG